MVPTDARSLSTQSQEDLRSRVIRAVTEAGVTQVQACRLFGVSRQAIHTWLTRYRPQGDKGLVPRRRGRPSRRGAGAAGATLYTGSVVRISSSCRSCCGPEKRSNNHWMDMQVSVWTVGRYLKRWGMTPQKPLTRAYERDPDAVARWLKTEYPQIREQAKKEEATLWWADEMGIRMDDQGERSYSMKGHTLVIPVSGQRFRCSMMSAITNRGRL